MCLSIWRRSPKAYDELQKSGMLKLPSGRLLQYHKNITSQEPGFNEDVLQWMVHEAQKKNIGTAGKTGGVILDEMAIQVLFLGTFCFYHNHSCTVSDVIQKFIT